ncbi:MAG: patatin-like phospholipase family protein [Rhodoferax sp.]|nr:patatin-like phospholipase family protein [Rhodoferax sp.]
MAPAPVRMPRLGIALGGGGTRGFAHVGVLKALESHQLAPSLIAGTSAGSVVGALYASGMTGFKLQETSFALDEARLKDLDLFGMSRGLVKGQKLQDYINELVNQRTLDQLGKPFVAVATDLDSGQRVVFARGNTGQAVRASCSIPGLFQPVEIAGKRYVDGGVVSPVPVDAVRQLGADLVIAVDISATVNNPMASSGVADVLGRALVIMGQQLGAQEVARADVLIRPHVAGMSSRDFEQKNQAILEGEKAGEAAIPALLEAIRVWQAAQRKTQSPL